MIRAILVVGLVTLAGGAARFWHLSEPSEKVFDEVYYASDGCYVAGEPFDACGLERDAERSWVHPPLGKQLIALGVDGFGNRPLGWRVAAAAAGTATIAIVGALAFLLTASPLWAGTGALLIATEHLHFVHSRIAMLDVFLAMFVTLGFLLLVWDRTRRDRRDEAARPIVAGGAIEEIEEPRPPRLGRSGVRPLRLGAGAALGAAVAVKWSGLYALAGAAVLAALWERTRRKQRGERHPWARAILDEGPALALAFAVVPLVAYLLPWLPWLADHGWSLGSLWSNHHAITDYHLTLEAVDAGGEPIHPYLSRAWTWFLLLRPVAYFYEGGEGTAAEILGIGNPLLFWGALLFVPYLLLAWWTQRDWRAGAVAVPIVIQYVPWLFVTRPLFLFYMAPITPFLALGATLMLRDVAGLGTRLRPLAMAAAALAVSAVVAAFVFFWPLLVGETIPQEAWQRRIWMGGWI